MAKYTIREEPAREPRKREYPLQWTGIVIRKLYNCDRCAVVLDVGMGKHAGIWFTGKPVNQLFYFFYINLLDTITVKGNLSPDKKENRGHELYLDDDDEVRQSIASDKAILEVERSPEYDEKMPGFTF